MLPNRHFPPLTPAERRQQLTEFFATAMLRLHLETARSETCETCSESSPDRLDVSGETSVTVHHG